MDTLRKKFDDFQKDLTAKEAWLDTINTTAQTMIEEGHSDADEIQRFSEVRSSLRMCCTGAPTQSITDEQCGSMSKSPTPSRDILQGLNQHWDDLIQLAEKKQKQLEAAYQVQKFIR